MAAAATLFSLARKTLAKLEASPADKNMEQTSTTNAQNEDRQSRRGETYQIHQNRTLASADLLSVKLNQL